MKTKVIHQTTICPRCKGKGRVFDVGECIGTCGIAFVLGLLDRNYAPNAAVRDGFTKQLKS